MQKKQTHIRTNTFNKKDLITRETCARTQVDGARWCFIQVNSNKKCELALPSYCTLKTKVELALPSYCTLNIYTWDMCQNPSGRRPFVFLYTSKKVKQS